MFYNTLIDSARLFPLENTIVVTHDMAGETVSMKDDYGSTYGIARRDELGVYTWKRVSVLVHAEVATAAHFEVPRSRTSRDTRPDPIVSPRVSAFMEPLERAFERFWVERGRTPLLRAEPIGSSHHEPPPRPERTRGKREEAVKALRPSTLQKFYRKFDGTGDPYDHVAQYRQLLFAEGITDVHTKVQAFGLTMEGRALAWFQTLKPSVLYNFKVLVKHFIEAYSKIGIKHNTITLILNFKQLDQMRLLGRV